MILDFIVSITTFMTWHIPQYINSSVSYISQFVVSYQDEFTSTWYCHLWDWDNLVICTCTAGKLCDTPCSTCPFHPFAQFHSPSPILVFTLFHLFTLSKVLYNYRSECEHTAPPLLQHIFVHFWCISEFDGHSNTISDNTTIMENRNTNSVIS